MLDEKQTAALLSQVQEALKDTKLIGSMPEIEEAVTAKLAKDIPAIANSVVARLEEGIGKLTMVVEVPDLGFRHEIEYGANKG